MFTVINDGLAYGKYFERYSTQFKEPNYLKSGMKQKLLELMVYVLYVLNLWKNEVFILLFYNKW